MPNKKFLEEYPLYKRFNSDLEYYHEYHRGIEENKISKSAIHMFCTYCESDQTFNMLNEYYENKLSVGSISGGEVKRLDYICSACRQGKMTFLIHFIARKIGEDRTGLVFEKVGQIPAWDISMDKELERLLGGYAEYYKKGLINESQGYGIGAFAYFRRITETIIDQLLDSIADLIEGDEKDEYEIALAETKKTTVTQDKIELVKDLLPASLRPDGMNPLTVLHSALSEGIHAKTDDECLEYADEIKQVLVYLVNQVERSRSASKSFTDSMRKILGKKSGKASPKNK